MELTTAQRSVLERIHEYKRMAPKQKLAAAMQAYQVRYLRGPGDRRVPKLRVRVVRYGRCSTLYVVIMRKHYLAGARMDTLLEKLALFGGWRRMDTCKGPAKRAFGPRAGTSGERAKPKAPWPPCRKTTATIRHGGEGSTAMLLVGVKRDELGRVLSGWVDNGAWQLVADHEEQVFWSEEYPNRKTSMANFKGWDK